MKTFIFLLLFPSFIYSQKDTIYRKDNKVIPCTITLDNEFTVFYLIKDIGYEINKSKLQWYSINGKRKSSYTIIDKTTLTNGNVLVDGIDINNLNVKYCEIIGYDYEIKNSSAIVINLDYGQSFNPALSMKIQDSEGKIIVFNSMVDALNFMEKSGWEYVNQYGVGGNTKKVYRILLKRK